MNPDFTTPVMSLARERDKDIVNLLRDNKREAAFDLVARRYESKVYRLCIAFLNDPEAAHDIAQESLIRVWKALPSYDSTAALSTWIYAITRNRCLTALAHRHTVLSLSDEEIEAEAENVAAEAEDNETVSTLHRMVTNLPETARRVITLFYFEERSVAEVAEMLGCPEGTVKTHLFRARALLLKELSAQGLANPEHWKI